MKRKNQKGFTLVEVIVVAVIVAVLAAVAIPLYIGYIRDANLNSATNAAGACASYLAAARNAQDTTLNAAGGPPYTRQSETGTAITFTPPAGITFAVTGSMAAGGTVTATKNGQTSASQNW
jgi:prepilin-type N-terminal cleavage/methylation domain-containing protein